MARRSCSSSPESICEGVLLISTSGSKYSALEILAIVLFAPSFFPSIAVVILTSSDEVTANNKYYAMIEAKYIDTAFSPYDFYYHLTSPYIAIIYPAGFVFNNNDYVKVINYYYRVQFLRLSKASTGPY